MQPTTVNINFLVKLRPRVGYYEMTLLNSVYLNMLPSTRFGLKKTLQLLWFYKIAMFLSECLGAIS